MELDFQFLEKILQNFSYKEIIKVCAAQKGRKKIVIVVSGRSSATLLPSPSVIFLDFLVFVLFFSFLKTL